MRKRSLIFALAFVLLLLCGCTSSVYPEETDTGMQTVKNGMIRLSIPHNEWFALAGRNDLYFHWMGDGDGFASIDGTWLRYKRGKTLTEEDGEKLAAQLEENMGGVVTVRSMEVRETDGRQFIFMETDYQFTREVVEHWLEEGWLSEEEVEEFGGIEGYIDPEPYPGVYVFFRVRGRMFRFSADWESFDGEDAALRCLEAIITTAE